MNSRKWGRPLVRLQKYLAECGIASRRASEELIRAGRVAVNGRAAEVGWTVKPGEDHVTVDEEPVEENQKIYIVLNKPGDVITTAKDTHGRRTVLDCVKGVKARVFPVGRLDRDVTGVLLLTNDGELAHRLTHPSYGAHKVYLAWVYGRFTREAARELEHGILLEDGVTAPSKVEILSEGIYTTQIRLTLHEGRKREVKRMCAGVGHPIHSLKRVAFGNIRTKGLRPGEWRYLTGGEVAALRRSVKLKPEGLVAQ